MGSIINKIVSLIKEAKQDIDPKLKAWIEAKYGPWNEKDFVNDELDTYFKTDPNHKTEGGGIAHNVIKLPSFSELIKQLKDTRDAANDLIRGESVRDDELLRGIYGEIKNQFNKFRTHLRKEYPAFYSQLKGQLTEEDLDEISTTGGGSAGFTPGAGMAYATPYAFKKPKKKQKAIPESKLTEDLDLSSYGYKLVPKDKAGNYVQKGSKLDVVNLFEDAEAFQNERIKAFDAIEQELNDIYKMLSNAKNETSDYYNDNPSSYNVIKPTDLVLDYVKDIKNLLKGE